MHLIVNKAINNVLFGRYASVFTTPYTPFIKEARGSQWNNFRYRYAVFSPYWWDWFRASLCRYAAVPYAFCSSLMRNNACGVIQYRMTRFDFLPSFFLLLITRVFSLFRTIYGFHATYDINKFPIESSR